MAYKPWIAAYSLSGRGPRLRRSHSVPTQRRVISTDRASAAIASYSQAIQVGETLYLAGQIGLDPEPSTCPLAWRFSFALDLISGLRRPSNALRRFCSASPDFREGPGGK
jgi:hypothetical protein